MTRIIFTTLSGDEKFFVLENATKYGEDSYHDGRNFISKATGLQFEHETLYKTKKGTYVLNSYSDYQGSADVYEEITETQAKKWLVKNDYDVDLSEKELDVMEG